MGKLLTRTVSGSMKHSFEPPDLPPSLSRFRLSGSAYSPRKRDLMTSASFVKENDILLPCREAKRISQHLAKKQFISIIVSKLLTTKPSSFKNLIHSVQTFNFIWLTNSFLWLRAPLVAMSMEIPVSALEQACSNVASLAFHTIPTVVCMPSVGPGTCV